MSRKPNYKSKALQVANTRNISPDVLFQCVDFINEENELNPYQSAGEARKAVCRRMMIGGLIWDRDEAIKIYNLVANEVMPFMNSGAKLSRADALLDKIIHTAKDYLEETYTDPKDGKIKKRLNVSVMTGLISAINTKANITLKTQSNLIAAEKNADERSFHENELNLRSANRSELEAALKAGLINHPEIAKIIAQREEDIDEEEDEENEAEVQE